MSVPNPGWRSSLLSSLLARDVREKALDEFMSAYARLAARAALPAPVLASGDDELKADLTAAQHSKTVLQGRIKAIGEEAAGLRAKVEVLERAAGEKGRLERRCVDLESEVKAKNRHIQELQDEMLTLTMELNVLADKEAATRKENKELVDRWMAEMAKKADAMNRDSKWE